MTEQPTFSSSVDDALSEIIGSFSESEVDDTASDEIEPAETLEEDNLEPGDDQVEDSDDDGDDDDVLVLEPDMEVVVDGKRVRVSDALQMRADYTKKTQALSEERASFENERAQFTEQAEYLRGLEQAWENDPAEVVAGFASATGDAIQSVGDAVTTLAKQGELDPNMFVVQTVVRLIADDMLDPELREMLGFDDQVVNQVKGQLKQDQRIRKLEREVRVGHQPAAKPVESDGDRITEARRQLEQQWDRIVESDDELSALDVDARTKVRSQVAKLALDRGGIPLDVAFELMQAEKLRAEREAERARAAVASRKQKTRVSSKPSNAAAAPSTPVDPSNLTDVIKEAFRELGG